MTALLCRQGSLVEFRCDFSIVVTTYLVLTERFLFFAALEKQVGFDCSTVTQTRPNLLELQVLILPIVNRCGPKVTIVVNRHE